ncbi:MAG: TrkH family potassium uptake protein [Gammaproteobacteria bacterium]|nr:TrkH family potassium uptake protein [Gammaproteobacteria bacterium]
MHLQAVQRILGLLLMVFSLTMLPPVLVSLIYDDHQAQAFLVSFLTLFLFGGLTWLPVRRNREDLRRRDGALIVSLFWAGLGAVGALPLLLASGLEISLTDAVFESISGLTTTGATVIVGLDDLPKSILFYRQLLQWLGGMGIIVLAVAILPLLGVGGMQLYRAETPGPSKDNKLTPKITETAKTLWMIYFGLTLACAVSYWLAGMTPFDAISHSFSTIAIGGFSTHDLSTGFFAGSMVEMVAIVFMFIAGANFALHFMAVSRLGVTHYFRDPEFRTYLFLLTSLTILASLYLSWHEHFETAGETMIKASFQVVSIMTTTGFTTDDFSAWPGLLPVVLILSSFIGACANSTGGGMKVIRWVLLLKQSQREVRRLIHPHAQFVTKMGNKPVSEKVVSAVWGFFSVYVGVFSLLMLLSMALGMDHVSAFSAVAACLNNLGPGLGEVAANYQSVPAAAKWVLMFAMLLGRLEIFTLLVILTPAFWRK